MWQAGGNADVARSPRSTTAKVSKLYCSAVRAVPAIPCDPNLFNSAPWIESRPIRRADCLNLFYHHFSRWPGEVPDPLDQLGR